MDLFTLFGTVAINADAAHKTIDSTTGKASGLANTFDKVGTSAASLGKTIAKWLAVGAGGAFLKSSIGAYADYEQLVGGVETLFKDSSGEVMKYASNAFQTAGMSANKYMETVTSFSATLVKGLGGDTAKAAEAADMAVTDMADNANKMGTPIESIQNAYQGFAKQNYTMLDNLKLGYGGTASEMARLINDSGVMGKKFKATAKNLKNIPFDKQIEAIHEMQKQMGITGTTAMESSETIAGSWASMGAAWENLLAGLSDGNADIDALMENLFTSVENVAKNIGKVAPSLMKNLGNMFFNVAKYAGQKIEDAWENTIYPFIQDKFKIAFGIDLPDWDTIKSTITTKWAEVKAAFDEGGLTKVFRVVLPSWDALVTSVSDGWNNTVLPKIQEFFQATFKVKLPDFSNTATILSTWWDNASGPMLENVKLFATDVGEALAGIAEWATGDGAKLLLVTGGLALGFAAVTGAIGLLHNPLALITAVTVILAANWGEVKDAVDNAFNTVVSWLTTNVGQPLETFRTNVIEPIASAWTTTVVPAISSAVDTVDGFLGLGLKAGWNDLTNAIQSAWDNIKSTVDSVTEAIKNLLGLNGNEGLGGENAAPWYVRQNPDKYSGYDNGNENGKAKEVPLVAAEGSEGEIQSAVEEYDLEGEALIEADPRSKSFIQAWIDAQDFRGTITLTPVIGDIPGFAKGIDRVPEDNMLAYLHKDEAVLTASEAAVWRGENRLNESGSRRMRKASAGTDQPITVNLTVNGVSSNPYEIAGEVRNALELLRWQA